jgi:hypothetical protein
MPIFLLNGLYNNDKIYVIGNDINDFDMLKKYNGYIVNNELNGIKTLNNFLELKDIIKK